MTYRYLCQPLLLVVACSLVLSSATAALPDDVKEILEKSIESSGGREALEAVESTRLIGTFSMAAMGMSGTSEAVHKQPDKVYISQEIPGMGEIVQAYNGSIGWARDPMQGFRHLSEQEIVALKQNESLADALDYESSYASGEVIGEEAIDGEAAWVVRLVDADTDREETHYYSKESGRLRKMEMVLDMGPMGQMPAAMKIKEYGEQEGIVYPKKMEMTNAGMVIEMTFDTLEINPKIDDSLFEPPQ